MFCGRGRAMVEHAEKTAAVLGIRRLENEVLAEGGSAYRLTLQRCIQHAGAQIKPQVISAQLYSASLE